MSYITLRKAWKYCMDTFPNIDQVKGDEIYEQIVEAYTSPDRAYHNVNHLINMVNTIQELFKIYAFDNEPEKRAELFFATFFHDIIYRPIIKNKNDFSDEQISANNALSSLEYMGLDNVHSIQRIYDLIVLSETHEINKNNHADKLMQEVFFDADIAILGAKSHIYKKYKDGLLIEYSGIPRETYYSTRMDFLQQINEKKTIFNTEYMNQLYSEQVRENINNELKEIDTLYAEELISQIQGI